MKIIFGCVVAFNDQVYERAFRDRGDKDKVRKTVLDTIRASENELFDTYINRLVDYVLFVEKSDTVRKSD